MEDPSIRRRNRPSLVCSACKRKKIRCDKGRPACIQCVKSDQADFCVYDSKWIPNNQKTTDSQSYVSTVLFSDQPSERTPSNSEENIQQVLTVVEEPLRKKSKRALDSKLGDEIVLVHRSELESLKLRLQKYESRKPELQAHTNNAFDDVNFRHGIDMGEKSQPVVSQVLIGDHNHKALNANIGTLSGTTRVPLHHPKLPGLLQEDCKFVVNEPAASPQLVKNYMVGINPFQEPSDTISFFKETVPAPETPWLRSVGPFAWPSILRKDHWLTMLKLYTRTRQTKTAFSLCNPLNTPTSVTSASLQSPDQSSEVSHQEFIPTPTSSDDQARESEVRFKCKEISEQLGDVFPRGAHTDDEALKSLNGKALNLGLSLFDIPVDRQLKLVEQVKTVMPKKRVIWMLLDRFFQYLYPSMPFLEEQAFLDLVSRLVGSRTTEDIHVGDNLVIETRIDLITAATLLLVLRLTFLSLFTNSRRVNDERMTSRKGGKRAQDRRYLMLNPVNMNTAEVAQGCIIQFVVLRRSSLPLIQSALFLRTYKQLAPEDGDGVDLRESHVLNGMIIHMAYEVGLHREPSPGSASAADEKKLHLGRKIWHSLLLADFLASLRFGAPLSTNSMFYDTQAPFVKPGNENLVDIELDQGITKCFRCADVVVSGPIKDILRLSLDVHNSAKLLIFTALFNRFELGCDAIFGRLPHYLRHLELDNKIYAYSKTKKASMLLGLKLFMLAIYFQMYTYYEAQKNPSLCFYFLKKMYAVSIEEMLLCFLPFTCKPELIFGEATNLVLNPSIIEAIYRANEINIISIVRSKAYLHRAEAAADHQTRLLTDLDYKNHFQSLSELVKLFEKCLRVCLVAASILSHRYYYAWGIAKSHSFLLKVITVDDFYETFKDHDLGIGPNNWLSSQLEDLIGTIKSTLDTLDKILTANCDILRLSVMFDKQNLPTKPSILVNLDSDVQPDKSDLTGTNAASVQPTVDPGSPSAGVDFDGLLSYGGNLISPNYVDLNDGDTAEIDSIWLKMLQLRGGQQHRTGLGNKEEEDWISSLQTPNQGEGGQLALDLDFACFAQPFSGGGHFDMFGDLPLEQLFSGTQ